MQRLIYVKAPLMKINFDTYLCLYSFFPMINAVEGKLVNVGCYSIQNYTGTRMAK